MGTTATQIFVEPRPDGRWAVKKGGSQRASRVMDRKDDAVARAREQARRQHAELVVMGADGRIQRKDSHGNDPRSIKG
jgi:uncharacterized protein YdaT